MWRSASRGWATAWCPAGEGVVNRSRRHEHTGLYARPIDLVFLGLWAFSVAVVGGLVGLVLGNIRLPVVLAFASSAAAGGAANIAISGVAAATASAVHIRAGRINWRLFAWMAPPSVAGAVLGGYLSGVVPETALLLVIAIVLLYSGADLLRWRRPSPADTPARPLDIRAAVISGAVIGLLGGFVGLILGALRMPALLRLVGETPAAGGGDESGSRRPRRRRRPPRPPAVRGARLGAARRRSRRLRPGRAARRPPDGPPLRAPARARDRHRLADRGDRGRGAGLCQRIPPFSSATVAAWQPRWCADSARSIARTRVRGRSRWTTRDGQSRCGRTATTPSRPERSAARSTTTSTPSTRRTASCIHCAASGARARAVSSRSRGRRHCG